MATEQAYYAMTAYYRMLDQKTSLYDMTDVIDMGGDILPDEAIEPLRLATEPAEESKSASGNWLWIIMLSVSVGINIVLIINRKKS